MFFCENWCFLVHRKQYEAGALRKLSYEILVCLHMAFLKSGRYSLLMNQRVTWTFEHHTWPSTARNPLRAKRPGQGVVVENLFTHSPYQRIARRGHWINMIGWSHPFSSIFTLSRLLEEKHAIYDNRQHRNWCFHAIEIDAISRETHVSFEVKLKALTIVPDSDFTVQHGYQGLSRQGTPPIHLRNLDDHRGKWDAVQSPCSGKPSDLRVWTKKI